MAVFIDDLEALAKLTQVEGRDWAEQDARTFFVYRAPTTFRYLLAAWRAGRATFGVDWKLVADKPITVVYGADGYARYDVVDETGELVLLASSTRQERCVQAEAAGFRVAR